MPPSDALLTLMRAGIDAADPLRCLPPFLPQPPHGRTLVLGAGKAAAKMARSVEDHWQGSLSGLVITRFGHGSACENISVVEAGHPVLETNGAEASRRMLALTADLTEDDLVLFLVSGGGSSLFEVPAGSLSLADIQATNRQLLASGAPISEMNCVRRRLSAVKGGRLLQHLYPARVVTLAISDVPGDDPSTIASGPTVIDNADPSAALEITHRYNIALPDAVRHWLETPPAQTETRPAAASEFSIIARPAEMVATVAAKARQMGFDVLNLGSEIEGESAHIGAAMAQLTLSLASQRGRATKPLLVVSGGETSVTMSNRNGRGGRNSEFLLALTAQLNGHSGISALAIDTDGIDGSQDNAGAFMGPGTHSRASALGMSPAAFLAENRSYDFFANLGDLIQTGPTGTNVNDLRLVLVGP
jgi:glycerate 2-kinase